MRAGVLGSIEGIRRKLRAVTAIVNDAGATAEERANAAAVKARLERRLKAAGVPVGDWTDTAFRFGRWAKGLRKAASPESAGSDWTAQAYRLGRVARRGYKKWFSG